MKAEETDLPDPEDFDDEDDNFMEDEPDYYYCTGCGKTTSSDPGGFGCPRCGAIMEPEYF